MNDPSALDWKLNPTLLHSPRSFMDTAGKGEMYVDCRISAPLFQGRVHRGWVTGKLRLPFIEG